MLGINSLSGKPLIPQPQCNEQKKECFTCVVDPGPFSAGCETNLVMQGRSSDSFRFRRLPGYPPVAEIVDSSCARFRTGTYSSGNCCRFSRHSLLIDRRLKPLFSNLCSAKIYNFGIIEKLFFIGLYRFILVTLFIPICSLVPPFVPISI